MQNKGATKALYAEAKDLTKRKIKVFLNYRLPAMITTITIIAYAIKVRQRWKKYNEELYNKEGRPTLLNIGRGMNVKTDQVGPDIIIIEGVKKKN